MDKKRSFFDFNKDSKSYKLINIFLTENEMQSLATTWFITTFWILYHTPVFKTIIRRDVFSNSCLIKCTTKQYVCYLAYENTTICDILYKPRKFCGDWKEFKCPKEIHKMLTTTMDKKQFKKTLSGIMHMKTFW